MAESADATDLKSVGSDTVRVRPPLAPQNSLRLHFRMYNAGFMLPYNKQTQQASRQSFAYAL